MAKKKSLLLCEFERWSCLIFEFTCLSQINLNCWKIKLFKKMWKFLTKNHVYSWNSWMFVFGIRKLHAVWFARWNKKKAAACTSKINTVSTVNGSTFQFRFAFQICFFRYFLLQNLIVVCEHKRINVFMFLHDHFISLVTALLRVALPIHPIMHIQWFFVFCHIACFFFSINQFTNSLFQLWNYCLQK